MNRHATAAVVVAVLGVLAAATAGRGHDRPPAPDPTALLGGWLTASPADEAERAASMARVVENSRVLDAVVTGRLTIAEGVEERLRINAGRQVWWDVLRAQHPGAANDRERAARQLAELVAWERAVREHDAAERP